MKIGKYGTLKREWKGAKLLNHKREIIIKIFDFSSFCRREGINYILPVLPMNGIIAGNVIYERKGNFFCFKYVVYQLFASRKINIDLMLFTDKFYVIEIAGSRSRAMGRNNPRIFR